MSEGFTLLELMLATFISVMVIGIVSVSLTFSLRMWERSQNQEPKDGPYLIDLLTMQLGAFNPLPIPYDGKTEPFFKGDEHSLTLATDYSVKSLSKGVAVIARYIYEAEENKLYYAEIPLDPYHPDSIEEFLNKKPREDDDSWPVFYAVEMADLTFEYLDEEETQQDSVGEGGLTLPYVVLVKWNLSLEEAESDDPSKTQIQRVVLGFLSSPSLDSLWSGKKKES